MTSSWFFLSSLNYDARSTTHQIYFSDVLQGLEDANFKLITTDVGGFGKQSDGGTFLASDLSGFIDGEKIIFPEPQFLPHSNVMAPCVMSGGEAYPLFPHLMKPYERNSLTNRRRALVYGKKNRGMCFWNFVF